MITYSPAKPADAYEIVLRDEDLQEILLLGVPVLQSIMGSILGSETAFTFRDSEGHIVSIAGVARTKHACHLWMLSTDLVSKHGKSALKIARSIVGLYTDETVPVCNYISKSAVNNRRFVEALGFVITDSKGSQFDYFYLEKQHV